MTAVEYEPESKTLTCTPEGRMDAATSPRFEGLLREELGALGLNAGSGHAVVFDLGKVDYVSSAFLRVCVATAQHLGGHRFSIVNTNPMVKKVFKIAGLDTALNVG